MHYAPPPVEPRKGRKKQLREEAAHEELPQTPQRETSALSRATEAFETSHAIARGQLTARVSTLGTPTNLTGGDAEEWADKKIVELLPLAVADLEWNLKYGDSEQRARASARVMDATGRGKKENGAAAVAPIIMLQGSVIPWLKREVSTVVFPQQPPHDDGSPQ